MTSQGYLVPNLSQAIYNISWEVLFIVYLGNNEDKLQDKDKFEDEGYHARRS